MFILAKTGTTWSLIKPTLCHKSGARWQKGKLRDVLTCLSEEEKELTQWGPVIFASCIYKRAAAEMSWIVSLQKRRLTEAPLFLPVVFQLRRWFELFMWKALDSLRPCLILPICVAFLKKGWDKLNCLSEKSADSLRLCCCLFLPVAFLKGQLQTKRIFSLRRETSVWLNSCAVTRDM